MVDNQGSNSDEIRNTNLDTERDRNNQKNQNIRWSCLSLGGKLLQLSDKFGEQVVRLQNLRKCLKSISERTAWMCKFPPLKQTVLADQLGEKSAYNMLATLHQLQPVVQLGFQQAATRPQSPSGARLALALLFALLVLRGLALGGLVHLGTGTWRRQPAVPITRYPIVHSNPQVEVVKKECKPPNCAVASNATLKISALNKTIGATIATASTLPSTVANKKQQPCSKIQVLHAPR